jgi:hypothetical protein
MRRRDVLKTLGVLASVATVGTLRMRTADAHGATGFVSLGVAPGMKLASSTVLLVGDVEVGTIPITLVDPDGRSFQLDVLRDDARSPAVARGGSLAVYVTNSGNGTLTTPEAHGLAAMALAAHLARREANGSPPPALLTLEGRAEQRRKLFPR